MSNLKIYVKSIFIPVLLGGIVGFFISGSMDYKDLVKPPLAPPSILFPIVWTILYILMGISYSFLESKLLMDSRGKGIYYFQLFVNLLWPIFFFVLKWRLFSFFWIILLLFLILLMIIDFYRKDKISGILQVPYLLWTIFAAYLNVSIYLLN